DDPKTFDEEMKSQDVAFWKEAINDEIDSIMGNNTWVLVDLPPGLYSLVFTITMEILPEPSSNKLCGRFKNQDKDCQGRLLSSFQDDAKYEHVGQDTRSQDGKDVKDTRGKDLEISELMTKSKDNDKGSRSKITKHEGTSLQQR
ncbi:hypothetical protein Tco_1015018, partial [Tanacetum coccineum]